MELLVVIGLAIVIGTAACLLVESMALARGRDARAWTLAAIAGLLFGLVGYVVVVAALLLLGPSRDQRQRPAPSRHLPHAPRP